jgi:predicted metalloendopeptidase
VSILLGAKEADAQKYAEEVWQLSRSISGALVSEVDRNDFGSTFVTMSVKDLQSIIDQDETDHPINVRHLLQKRFQIDIPKTEKIMVIGPEYFRKVGRIVKAAKPAALASFIAWSVIRSMVTFAGSAYEGVHNRIVAESSGVSSSPSWEQCITETQTALGFASGALYVEKYFSETDKKNIENIMAIFKEELAAQMSIMSWMDEETRKRARDKVLAMKYKVGYPDFIINPQLLDQYYQNLTVSNSTFTNIIKYRKFKIWLNNKRFGRTPDRDEWTEPPTVVNAYYDPQANQIIIPASILQQPVYHHSYPMSVIFGTMGFIAGHELMHGFDNKGRQFDKDGNLINWWTPHPASEFVKRSQCFINQYSKFEVVKGHFINGQLTLGENIADNAGLKLSYAAYNRWASKNTDEIKDQLLPALNMTRSQQFFLAAAQTWCGSATEQFLIDSIEGDIHTNARFRIIGTFRNMPEFAQAFSCSKTAALNPPEKCTIF